MKWFLIILLLLVSCTIPVSEDSSLSSRKEAGFQEETHNGDWIPIFFEEIAKRAEVAQLAPLKSATLSGSDLEIRLWRGFGLAPLEGLVLKRRGGNWSAVHLRPINSSILNEESQQVLYPPKSGWNHLWDRISTEGITILPDPPPQGDEEIYPDGESYVIEVNTNRGYRTYRYGVTNNHQNSEERKEERKIDKIVTILYDEFGLAN